MTRSFPREVVMLVPLQLEAVCMQNAMLKESHYLFEVATSLATSSTSTASVQAAPLIMPRVSQIWPLIGRSAMFDFDGTLSIHCRHWSSSEQEWKSWAICSSASIGLTPFIKEYLIPSLSTKNRALRRIKAFRKTTHARRTAKAPAKAITWSLPRLCHAPSASKSQPWRRSKHTAA